MAIIVRSKDGKARSLRDIVSGHLDLESKINIKKSYFAVSKQLRKRYAIISLSGNGNKTCNPDIIISFADEINGNLHYATLKENGIYPTRFLSRKIGEGIYDLEQEDDSYKILHPKK